MALDIVFYRQKKHLTMIEKKMLDDLRVQRENAKTSDETNKIIGAEWDLQEKERIAGFCKVNFLIQCFNYDENMTEITVTREQIEDVMSKCKLVLENHNLASKLLPTVDGPFFGSLEYDEWYFGDVEGVLHVFEKILSETNFDTHKIVMWCWW